MKRFTTPFRSPKTARKLRREQYKVSVSYRRLYKRWRPALKHVALLGGMYLLSLTVIAIESGSLTRAAVAAVGTCVLKCGWVVIHERLFS